MRILPAAAAVALLAGVDLPGTSWETNVASIAPMGSGWVSGGSAIGLLSALVVAVVLRRRTTTRRNLATA